LISTKLIVTAAHCIQNKKEDYQRKVEHATFYIGKHNLDSLTSEKNFIAAGVEKFMIHPDWNYEDDRYDADLAMVVLTRSVEFSKFIQPICLWTNTNSNNDFIEKAGLVAGWGKTEFDAIATESPRFAIFPVVNEGECLRSNEAFTKLTSNRTFCAGKRTGTGPCSGDSGGGFIVKIGEKWYLRGMVSAALFDKENLMCDAKQYAIFTDTTKFTSWMQDFIDKYG
jgi:secreted trypsin-like serine protease